MEEMIVPIPKHAGGGNCDAFRGITLGSPLSKILEIAINHACKASFDHPDLRFGFSERHSTGDGTFVLKESIDYACRTEDMYMQLLWTLRKLSTLYNMKNCSSNSTIGK